MAHLGALIAEIAIGARFFLGLPSFLRHPIGVEEARAILRRRLERREEDFLAVVRRAVYEYPPSPYRQLLRLADCEYGDLVKLVDQDGVEGALHTLLRHGVYLTVEEFKGRRPVVRGSATIALGPSGLRNPCSAFHVPARSGGSRSRGTPVLIDFAFIRDCAVNTGLSYEARNGGKWLKAVWEIPGGGALFRLLQFSSFGSPPVRWFSQVDPAAPGLEPRYRWSARALRWGSLIAGVPLPSPQVVSPEDPLPIAHWIAEVLRAGGIPHLGTFTSSAVRLCQVAFDAGIHLGGAQFTLGGEPMTVARLVAIRRAGAEALPRYGSIECGPVGYGCLAPEAPDDLHALHDLHALVQPGPDGEGRGVPARAFLLSSLRPTAPMILLNVSMGDQGVMVPRRCGCPLERLGWTTHLHTVRSFEKLTAGGMTFLDTDVIRVLEEVLPARFGGGPTHYQLMEEEADDGRARLRLLVHPAVGSVNADEVKEAFLTAISPGSGVERVMGLLWRQADLLQVERRAPLATAAGKILHLHLDARRVTPS